MELNGKEWIFPNNSNTQQQQQQQPVRKAYISITKLPSTENNNNNNNNNSSPPSPKTQQTVTNLVSNTNSTPINSASTTTSISNRAQAPINYERDITKDLFANFERQTLLAKRENSANSILSNESSAVTEASYVGNVKIHEVNKNGYFVRLLNLSHATDEDLGNYTLQQMVSTMPVAVFRMPPGTKLAPGHTMTIWARTDEVAQQPPHTFVWYEQDKWGTGPECTTILAKPNGKAVSWTTGCHKYGNIGKLTLQIELKSI
jgi:hypothetical protein